MGSATCGCGPSQFAPGSLPTQAVMVICLSVSAMSTRARTAQGGPGVSVVWINMSVVSGTGSTVVQGCRWMSSAVTGVARLGVGSAELSSPGDSGAEETRSVG